MKTHITIPGNLHQNYLDIEIGQWKLGELMAGAQIGLDLYNDYVLIGSKPGLRSRNDKIINVEKEPSSKLDGYEIIVMKRSDYGDK